MLRGSRLHRTVRLYAYRTRSHSAKNPMQHSPASALRQDFVPKRLILRITASSVPRKLIQIGGEEPVSMSKDDFPSLALALRGGADMLPLACVIMAPMSMSLSAELYLDGYIPIQLIFYDGGGNNYIHINIYMQPSCRACNLLGGIQGREATGIKIDMWLVMIGTRPSLYSCGWPVPLRVGATFL